MLYESVYILRCREYLGDKKMSQDITGKVASEETQGNTQPAGANVGLELPKGLKLRASKGGTNYSLEEDGGLYVERYWFPMPKWSNCYGDWLAFQRGAKRVKVALGRFTAGYATGGLGMNDRVTDSVTYISITRYQEIISAVLKIANEQDTVESEFLTAELASGLFEEFGGDSNED